MLRDVLSVLSLVGLLAMLIVFTYAATKFGEAMRKNEESAKRRRGSKRGNWPR
jgi:hypothetical protein